MKLKPLTLCKETHLLKKGDVFLTQVGDASGSYYRNLTDTDKNILCYCNGLIAPYDRNNPDIDWPE